MGLEIWTDSNFVPQDRDYFLPLPDEMHEGTIRRMANYSSCAAMSRQLLHELRIPIVGLDGRWMEGSALLIPAGGALYFTEHSPRHLENLIAASLKIPMDRRDFLGRWNLGGGSNDYLNTSMAIVLQIQDEVGEAIAVGPSPYDENDAMDDYIHYLEAKYPHRDSRQLRRESKRMLILDASGCLKQTWPLLPLGGEPTVMRQDPEGSLVTCGLEPAEKKQKKRGEDEEDNWLFWNSITRTGFRRVHKREGCRFRLDDCFQWEAVRPGIKKANKACLLCWPEFRKKDLSGSSESNADSEGQETSSSSSEEKGSNPVAHDTEMSSGSVPQVQIVVD